MLWGFVVLSTGDAIGKAATCSVGMMNCKMPVFHRIIAATTRLRPLARCGCAWKLQSSALSLSLNAAERLNARQFFEKMKLK
jgi:hypothetical protein